MTGSEKEPVRRGVERRIDEEMRFHIEGRTEELMASGMSRGEAEREALAAFGDVSRVRSELRSIGDTMERRTRRREWVGGWLRDIRTGARRLRRSPGYALVGVLTLGLGIGASVAMFTVLNAVVLRPLPYAEPDRLVHVWPESAINIAISRRIGGEMPSLSSYTAVVFWGMTLTGEGAAQELDAAVVDAGYFEVFGVQPALGRVFLPEETVHDRSGVVLISYGMWQDRFGGDREIIGRTIELGGYGHTQREVIGVMPEGFEEFGQGADLWIPLNLAPGRTAATDSSWYVNGVFARLAPGAGVERATAELRSTATRLRGDFPGLIEEEVVRSATVIDLLSAMVGDARRTLWLLLAAVGLVLMIACANLANLALARASGQRRELAVQLALGASRLRLIRHQVAEGAIIAVLGGFAGALMARTLLAIVRVAESSGLPRTVELSTDWRVLAFATAASVGALIGFGVLPAIVTTRGVMRGDLQDARGGSRGKQSHRLNRLLVSGELALATLLTTGAATVLVGFVTLRSTDPGVDTSDVLALSVLPAADRYRGDSHSAYMEELQSRFAALPGVTSVGSIQILPFTLRNWSYPYLAQGHAPPSDGPLPSANFRMITPGYLEAVDQPLVRGRDFTSADRAGAPNVMLLNRTLAESLWPGEDPVGRTIALFGNMNHEVVGVVEDVHQRGLADDPLPEMYVPQMQWNRGGAYAVFMIEGGGALDLAGEARDVVASIDPDVPITLLSPLSDVLDQSLARPRFIVLVLGAFGILALVLGGIGVHGVMSNLVGRRLGDYGVQLALGASPGRIQRSALFTGLVPVLFGLAAGGLASFAAAGVLRGLAGELPAAAPLLFGVVAVVLVLVAIVASWLPARRAARADPLSVLRSS